MSCNIDDCNEEVHGRGMCSKHYTRWYRHGDASEVKKVGAKGYNGPKSTRAMENDLISKYKRRAQRKGIEWSLTRSEAISLFTSDCYYCGVEPQQEHGAYKDECESFIYNGIDRVDNSGNYEKGNVVPCCKVCNRAKYQFSKSEFRDYLLRIAEKYKDMV